MSKYCKEIVEEICGYISEGLNQEDAQILSGISHQTFHRWKDTKDEFSEALKSAKINNKLHHLKVITKEGDKGQWQASAWYLERMHKAEYSLRTETAEVQPIIKIIEEPLSKVG